MFFYQSECKNCCLYMIYSAKSRCKTNLESTFSNSLIIHAALTQPEHLILVRWMSLEIQWKPSWKHGFQARPCFQLGFHWISKLIHLTRNTDANFLNLHIDKATKTRGDKQLYLITHFTKQTLNLYYLLLTLNVTEQFLKNLKQKRPFFF